MNDPQAPLRWRISATIGPELVALGITVVLAIVVVIGLVSGGSAGRGGPSPTPERSRVTSEVGASSQTSWSPNRAGLMS